MPRSGRVRRHATISPLVIALATLISSVPAVAAPFAPAGTWDATTPVTSGDGAALADADLHVRTVLVGFLRPAAGPGSRLRIARSTNGGASFGRSLAVRSRAREAAVDSCRDGTPVALYGHRASDATEWVAELSARIGSTWDRRVVSGAGEGPRHPDVACEADFRVIWGTWIRRDGSTLEVEVVRTTSTDPGLPATVTVGETDGQRFGPVIALIPGGAFVAWTGPDGDILGRRIFPGGGGLTMGPVIEVGPGTAGNPSLAPSIGTFNQRVVVSWARCADVFGRVSTDAGVSWLPVRRLADYACPGEIGGLPRSAAVRGQDIAVAYLFFGPAGDRERLITSDDDLASRRDRAVTIRKAGFLAGYLRLGGATRLGVVYDSGPTILFRRCSNGVCGRF
jgi:hypothetical protein